MKTNIVRAIGALVVAMVVASCSTVSIDRPADSWDLPSKAKVGGQPERGNASKPSSDQPVAKSDPDSGTIQVWPPAEESFTLADMGMASEADQVLPSLEGEAPSGEIEVSSISTDDLIDRSEHDRQVAELESELAQAKLRIAEGQKSLTQAQENLVESRREAAQAQSERDAAVASQTKAAAAVDDSTDAAEVLALREQNEKLKGENGGLRAAIQNQDSLRQQVKTAEERLTASQKRKAEMWEEIKALRAQKIPEKDAVTGGLSQVSLTFHPKPHPPFEGEFSESMVGSFTASRPIASFESLGRVMVSGQEITGKLSLRDGESEVASWDFEAGRSTDINLPSLSGEHAGTSKMTLWISSDSNVVAGLAAYIYLGGAVTRGNAELLASVEPYEWVLPRKEASIIQAIAPKNTPAQVEASKSDLPIAIGMGILLSLTATGLWFWTQYIKMRDRAARPADPHRHVRRSRSRGQPLADPQISEGTLPGHNVIPIKMTLEEKERRRHHRVEEQLHESYLRQQIRKRQENHPTITGADVPRENRKKINLWRIFRRSEHDPGPGKVWKKAVGD